jgi:NADPH:quinone reductase-like Zn-dependent oxidoreductase
MPEIAKWAVIGQHFGPPESYELVRYDPGDPAAGEVRVAIKAAGISYVDVLTARGEYQFKPPLPFIPGSEYAGVVEALGVLAALTRPMSARSPTRLILPRHRYFLSII